MTAQHSHARQLAHVLVFITPALWSVNYLVARWAPGVIAPHALLSQHATLRRAWQGKPTDGSLACARIHGLGGRCL